MANGCRKLTRSMQPILVADLFAPLNDELVSLLRGLAPEEWNGPTAAGTWTVKDVAAHLLDTALRRLALQRDAHVPGGAFDPNATNREWIDAARRLSPRILIELLDRYGAEAASYLGSLDPFAIATWPVTWAGDRESPVWFDVARELTERWHHQQQIRDATARPPLYHALYFAPVIDTFVRVLPHAYRAADAPDGMTVVLRVTGEGEGAWSLVRAAESRPRRRPSQCAATPPGASLRASTWQTASPSKAIPATRSRS
jgi:uncharacterized protein (TIGR03083 family)